MKYLKYYKKLDLPESPEPVFKHFMSSLQESIKYWNYFVDWSKADNNLKAIEMDLNLLN